MTDKKVEVSQGRPLVPQEIQIAMQSLVSLIRAGKVEVPSDMAMNGTLGMINSIALGLAQGSAVLVAPSFIEELQKKAGEKPAKKTARRKSPAKKKPAKRAASK